MPLFRENVSSHCMASPPSENTGPAIRRSERLAVRDNISSGPPTSSFDSFQCKPTTSGKRKREEVNKLPTASAATVLTPSPTNAHNQSNAFRFHREATTPGTDQPKLPPSKSSDKENRLPANVYNLDEAHVDFTKILHGLESSHDTDVDGSLQECNQHYWNSYAQDYYSSMAKCDSNQNCPHFSTRKTTIKLLTSQLDLSSSSPISGEDDGAVVVYANETTSHLKGEQQQGEALIFSGESLSSMHMSSEEGSNVENRSLAITEDAKSVDSSLSSHSSMFHNDDVDNSNTVGKFSSSNCSSRVHSSSPIQQTNYYPLHPDLTPKMRTILMDWLVEVCDECKFSSLTLFYTVQLADRVLNLTSDDLVDGGITEIPREMLQCVGW